MAKAEQTVRDQLKAETETARREASKAAEAQIRVLQANQEMVIKQRVQAAREGVENPVIPRRLGFQASLSSRCSSQRR
jgi:3-dehydroquinate dehydratase